MTDSELYLYLTDLSLHKQNLKRNNLAANVLRNEKKTWVWFMSPPQPLGENHFGKLLKKKNINIVGSTYFPHNYLLVETQLVI